MLAAWRVACRPLVCIALRRADCKVYRLLGHSDAELISACARFGTTGVKQGTAQLLRSPSAHNKLEVPHKALSIFQTMSWRLHHANCPSKLQSKDQDHATEHESPPQTSSAKYYAALVHLLHTKGAY
jgi:hypothetical protein